MLIELGVLIIPDSIIPTFRELMDQLILNPTLMFIDSGVLVTIDSVTLILGEARANYHL
jgi:hypothetical protein